MCVLADIWQKLQKLTFRRWYRQLQVCKPFARRKEFNTTGQWPKKGGIPCGSSFFAEDGRRTYRWQESDDMDTPSAKGLADFSTNKGLPSLHISFGQDLMKKAVQIIVFVFLYQDLAIISEQPGGRSRWILHIQEVYIVPQLCGNDQYVLFVLSGVQEGLHRDVLAGQTIANASQPQITNHCLIKCSKCNDSLEQSVWTWEYNSHIRRYFN